MKIAISYPPIINELGQKAMVSQNRNVQYFKEPTYLLPVNYAQAATWLKINGYNVLWDDGNAQLKNFNQWFEDIIRAKPDIILFESTTPVMKFYWETINKLKNKLNDVIIIMSGYHSMRMPEETLNKSNTDIVLRSSHVDFVMKRLVKFISENPDNWREECQIGGLFIRQKDDSLRSTGNFRQVEKLDNSPIINSCLLYTSDAADE